MAKSDWVNKPVPFKKTDETDAARYKFARGLPNFAQTVKDMLDWMELNGLKTFEVPGSVGRIPLREFTQNDSEVDIEEFDEQEATEAVDAGQFL